MSWISDVRSEMHRLKCTSKELRKFAYLVGSVLVLMGGAGFFKHWHFSIMVLLWLCAATLLCMGLLYPKGLRGVYVVWMGIAFSLGWVMSRAILILLFYFVITPIGVAARIFGKKFIDINFSDSHKTYWVERGNSKKMDYEKLF
ncbi:MAG: SxtJ family membrane protein [Bacteroidota bacterium]